MIGIVIVSHSAKLAEGIRELAMQMVKDRVPIAVAGGIEDPHDPIGTDPLRVAAAIEAVYSVDGVLVLMDLGSALMSAETALEFLEPDQQKNVFLCEAPVVEGTIAAAVEAMLGRSITQVMAAARNALIAKRQQLAPLLPQSAPEASSEPLPNMAEALVLTLTVPNRLGLHARPLVKLIELINHFSAEVYVTKNATTVNGRSINQMAALGARQGDELHFQAVGQEAAATLTAIQALAADNFADLDGAARTEQAPVGVAGATKTVAPHQRLGIPASVGIAIGPVAAPGFVLPAVVESIVDDAVAEWQRFQAAIQAALAELQAVQRSTQQTVGPDPALIFAAHRLILQDPELQENVRRQIIDEHRNAEAAWQQALQGIVDRYQAIEDDYLRARIADVLDSGQRVLRHLLKVALPTLEFEQSVILVAEQLMPSDTARLDPTKILGLVTSTGGATSHSAILARALGIPAIVGVTDLLSDVTDGQVIALDGATGQIWLAPTPEVLADLQQKRTQWLAAQQVAIQAGRQSAITRDGKRIEIGANISSHHDLDFALEMGAEGVGLFRSEFLWMGREQLPDEAEQLLAFRTAAQKLDARPLIIRTLDVGGDKPIAYLGIGAEMNPFLGWRGIRYCLDNPEIFKPHLRAILRASAEQSIKLMLPMVSTVAEVQRAKTMIAAVQDELRSAGIAFDHALEIGIMIETPSAVLLADQLAQTVDFFSIGTNDLAQYLMAADRDNAQVASLANALQPTVIRAIQHVVQAAHAAGIWVGMCGELAGNPLATALLVGLGLDELSMHARAIPQVKARIQQLELTQAQQLAEKCLTLGSVTAIEELLAEFAPVTPPSDNRG
ncbi:MAG: phosphoenolpyruvate--protein phosphotransferase [Chloroflexi bacterium]|nr:phosphoenolpyruvate--protein phosphotransferase [Chloroflexota bacterium]